MNKNQTSPATSNQNGNPQFMKSGCSCIPTLLTRAELDNPRCQLCLSHKEQKGRKHAPRA